MARYNVPGVSIAVIDNGTIAWAKGYGTTREDGTLPVSESTLFQAASIAKLVAATGALRLVQHGVLDLDRDVNLQLRAWRVPPNQFTAEHAVTLRELLSHRAGITVHGFSGYAHGDSLPSLRQILDGEPPANSAPIRVDMTPGSQFRYSGGGYLVVQQLVIDATGQSFAQVMQDEVLGPVGMTSSTFMLPLSDERKGLTACGHTYSGESVEGCWNRYPETAAAGLWSTPTDLAKLGLALSAAAGEAPNSILSKAIATQMLGGNADETGLGPGVHGAGEVLHFDHAGWNNGFRSYLVVYPALGKGAVVMANGDGGDLLINEIVRSIARTYRWPDYAPEQRNATAMDTAALDARAGEYDVRAYGLTLNVRRERDHLIVSTPRGSWYTFYPAGDTTFFATEDGSELTFTCSPQSRQPILRVWGMAALRRTDQPPPNVSFIGPCLPPAP
ncbi:MAG TPA: serine hydrolase domain-containing protein [Gemmatimonadaceae bacterium]|nr:serine hydrolase domain-containing protein [Gemmatimonadaceae bacterium]